MPDTDPLTALTQPATPLDSLIAKHSERTGLDPELVRRLVSQESRGHSNAVSPKGAGGTMQLMPATAASLGVKNRFDPDENIRGGTDYLKQQLDKFGDVNLALAAYNAGPGAVQKYGNKVPPYKETQDYVKKIGGGYQGTGYAQDPLTALTKQAPTPDKSGQDPLAELTQQPPAVAAFNELNQQPRQPRTRPKKSILSAATGGMGGGKQGIEAGGKVGQPDQVTSTRAGLRGLAEMSGAPTQLLPQDTQDWLNEAAAQGASQLMTTGAGIARQAGPIGSAPARAVGIKAPFDRNQITRDVANTLQGGAQQIQSDVGAAQAQRGTLSRATQNLVAGSIGSAPAMILTSLGVSPAVAFGLQSELQASGRDADFKDIVKETAKGATIGALFSAPLPVKRELLSTLQAALLKAGIVGAGTAAITGSPQEALTNAAFAATGGGKGEQDIATVREGAETRATAGQPAGDTGNVGVPSEARNAGAATEIPQQVPEVRHVDLQRRLDDGTFGKETTAEREARQSQVAATEAPTEQPNTTVPQSTPEPQPSAAVSPSQPLEAVESPSPAANITKPSRLAQGVEAKAIEAKLTEGFKDLPEYNTITLKDQAERAVKLLNDDPDLAKQIATGKAEPPQGLHPESVFIALENRALQTGDVQTIEDLARGPQSVENSIMGQRLRILGERNPASPVKAIADIEKARSAGVPKEKVAQTVNKIKSELSVEMKKSAPKIKDWASFLESIKC